ncbi:alpha/beta fold hydrolase [Nocardia arizonensis]|uniref:alpha/beta fold hydrolase n=1 Tax=Nocardia arizonensis TaxID=1141647 RepID=UPI0006D23C44|nr:alpha/beta hydrolase [Nocardia arizonensis]
MSPSYDRHPSTVSDWSDARRRARLRETRLGHGWQTLRRTRLISLRMAAVLIAVLFVFVQYWTIDVAPERDRLAHTEPSVLPVAQPADERNWDTVVVDMVGLGGLNASDTAASLPSLRRMGVVWAIRYDNRGIDTKVIADLITRAALMSGMKNVILVGHSMGGVVALEVGKHIHTHSDRRLVAVLLDCTPMDLNAVRPQSRGRGEDMVRWMRWLPGARESRALRTAVETYARREQFLDRSRYGLPGVRSDRLQEVVDDVWREKILSADVASNGLIESQFLAIVAGGAVDDLRALSEPVDGKPRPAVVFLRPRDPSADTVVDVAYSHRLLVERVGGVDGSLLVVFPRGTGHANPRQRPSEYNRVIADQVLPFVQRYQAQARAAGASAAPR